MKALGKNEKINLYGNLNIRELDRKIENNINISIENVNVKVIGDYLYKFLEKEYEKYNYDWDNIRKKLKRQKL